MTAVDLKPGPFRSGVQALRPHASAAIPAGILVLAYALVGVVSPSFFSANSFATVATQATPLIFLAVGLTPVIILGGIDLSLAALTSLVSIVLVQLVPGLGGFGLVLALLLAAGAGAVVGLVHAIAQVPSFVVTLGAFGLYTGLALQLSGANNIPLGDHAELVTWTTDLLVGIPVGFLVAIVFAAVVALALYWVTAARWTYDVGAGEQAALMSGVRPLPLRVGIFALAGLSAGLASLPLIGSTTFAAPSLGNSFLLPAIASVVIGGTAISGGTGGPIRSVFGALIVTVVQIGLIVLGVGAVYQDIVFGLVIIVAVALTTDRAKLVSIK